ncbi:type IV secretory system conjugative DNA transfer family protein [Bacillus tropicus]|uniref:VirD4-like conjugal transfer protein, CD1115 family n=1 Tax=Bacillus tropicus TaxID=2026188 RepID=UPI002E1FA4BF|nr:type IV secretory system conjugative DNA transfer family protein [Bacillus tropicus]
MKGKGRNKFVQILCGLTIGGILGYFYAGLLRVLKEHNNLQDNLKDYEGTIQFMKTTDKQMQILYLVVLVISMGFVISKMGLKNKEYEDASDFGVHGTSRWGTILELLKGGAIAKDSKYSEKDPFKTLKVENGIILGRDIKTKKLIIVHDETTVDNQNVNVVGSSGSGKGQAFAINNLINNRERTIICTDPKGELYNLTHKIKEDQGYKVYQIDFINFESNAYNPLDYVKDDQEALQLAKTISKNSKKDDKEDYFFNTAKDLLAGLIIYCKNENPNANIPKDVKREFYRVSDDENYLRELCDAIGEDHPAYNLLKDASIAEGKTRTSILSSFAQQTGIFSLQKVARMTTHSDFNFREFQKEKSILYIKIRMDENPFTPLTATFFDQLITVFYDIADRNDSKLPIPSIFLLDEFANIGKIEKYGRVLSTCRGLGMSMITIIQDNAQLENLYGKEVARTIINNHDFTLFLRTKDPETAKYYSNLAGETTVRMTSESLSSPSGMFSGKSSSSKSVQEQYVKRPLITEGELINIDKQDCYVFISGYYPLKLKKAWQFVIYKDFLKNYDEYRERYRSLFNHNDKKVEELTDNELEKDVKVNLQKEKIVQEPEPQMDKKEEVELNIHEENETDNLNDDINTPQSIEKLARDYLDGKFTLNEYLPREKIESINMTLFEEEREYVDYSVELETIMENADFSSESIESVIKIKQGMQSMEDNKTEIAKNVEMANNIDDIEKLLSQDIKDIENDIDEELNFLVQ